MEQDRELPAGRPGRVYGLPKKREQVIAMLSEAYARDDLDQAEFERRLELAERAGTIEDLEALTADFPPDAVIHGEAPAGAAPLSEGELEREIARLDGLAAPRRTLLVGDLHVDVPPSSVRVLRIVSVFGDSTVDLRALSGLPGAFLLKVASFAGDTKVLVPRGTRVHLRVMSLAGDQSIGRPGRGFFARIAKGIQDVLGKPETPAAPPGPALVVNGFKVFGDVKVIED